MNRIASKLPAPRAGDTPSPEELTAHIEVPDPGRLRIALLLVYCGLLLSLTGVI
ncbi:MAG: hypothetical protein Kow0020_13160 [Wenzhouxiangellaceae bacterium]